MNSIPVPENDLIFYIVIIGLYLAIIFRSVLNEGAAPVISTD
jgi:hypothetical protein